MEKMQYLFFKIKVCIKKQCPSKMYTDNAKMGTWQVM